MCFTYSVTKLLGQEDTSGYVDLLVRLAESFSGAWEEDGACDWVIDVVKRLLFLMLLLLLLLLFLLGSYQKSFLNSNISLIEFEKIRN